MKCQLALWPDAILKLNFSAATGGTENMTAMMPIQPASRIFLITFVIGGLPGPGLDFLFRVRSVADCRASPNKYNGRRVSGNQLQRTRDSTSPESRSAARCSIACCRGVPAPVFTSHRARRNRLQ